MREYSHALCLTSELVDLRAANANRILPPATAERDSLRALFPEFRALREYSHTLRLASELADLRVANANRILLRPQKEKYKILPDISPDHRGREKYTRNFAPLAVRMLRTGSRALCARGTVRFVRSTSKKAGHQLVSCFFWRRHPESNRG